MVTHANRRKNRRRKKQEEEKFLLCKRDLKVTQWGNRGWEEKQATFAGVFQKISRPCYSAVYTKEILSWQKSWQWEKSTNWEGKQNSVEKWKDRFASRQVSVFFGTSVKFHGIETTWHWKLKNAHLTVFTRKPVVNPCQYMLWMCRRASGDKCKQALNSSSSFDSFMLINPQTFARHSAGKAPLLQINAAVENHKKAFCSAYMKIYRGLKVSFSMTYGTFDSTVQKWKVWEMVTFHVAHLVD